MKYKITPHKEGKTWSTKYNNPPTLEDLEFAVSKLIRMGYTYLQIEVIKE